MNPFMGFLSAAVAGVLLPAGLLKLFEPTQFERFVTALGVAKSNSRWLSRSVAVLEVLVAAALLGIPSQTPVRVMAVGVTGLFVGVLLLARAKAIGVDCGCFGSFESASWLVSVVRALLLVAAAGVLLLGSGPEDYQGDPSIRFVGLAGGAFIVLATLALSRLSSVLVRSEATSK